MERPRILISIPIILLLLFVTSGPSQAVTDKKTLIVKAKIEKMLKLIVDTNLLTFSHKDPDETTEIPALQNDVKVVVKARTESTSPVTLDLIADGDLFSGSDMIPVQNIIWQASGKGFLGGTLSKASVQTAGFWKGSGIREGAFRYYLRNSWNYSKGDYQVTITYTLITP
jgi:hypothetical protein